MPLSTAVLSSWRPSARPLIPSVRRACKDFAVELLTLSVATVALLALICLVANESPLVVTATFVAPLTSSKWIRLISEAAPLWLAAVAFSIPLRTGFVNLAGESQILLGAVTSGMLATTFSEDFLRAPFGPVVALAACLAVACLMAALWALVPVLLKMRFGADEVIVGLLLNPIGFSLATLLIKTSGATSPFAQGIETQPISASLLAPLTLGVGGGQSLTILVFLYAVALVLAHIAMWWTGWGLKAHSCGANRKAAMLIGLNVVGLTVTAALVGGILAGAAGLNQLFSVGRFRPEHFVGLGFDGITTAILGRHRAEGILVASIYLSLLREFSLRLQSNWNIPYESFLIMEGVIILAYLWRSRGTP